MGKLDQQYWDNRYKEQQTQWDIGYPSTPLKAYVDQLADKDISILIPGCGNAYEAEYLLQQGFNNVTLIDISPVVTSQVEKQLEKYLDKQLKIITGDFFELEAQFDLVIEQTFFCALDPSLREAYAKKMNEVLRPGGKLVGVLFNRDFTGGPPFGGNKAEYDKLLQPHFSSIYLEPCYNSIKPREGSELFLLVRK